MRIHTTLTRLLEEFDALFAGAWWWRWQRRRAEGQLDRVLKSHGELSIETARATDRVVQLDFASLYWRATPGPIRCVVEAARRGGVPLDVLRLAVVNRNLMLRGGRVHVRRSPLLRLLAVGTGALYALYWLLMIALALAHTGPWPLKLAVVIAVTVSYALMYRGWSLFTGRPSKAIARWGDNLQRVVDAQVPARVTSGRFHVPQ